MSGQNPASALLVPILTVTFLAVGGANAVIPELQRHAVDVAHWMSNEQFADLFAISTASPGPNFLIVTLIGLHVAGVKGALVATLAFCLPTAALIYGVSHLWNRFREARWRIAIQAGLVPVTTGLIAASAYIVARAADTSWRALAITLASAAITYRTRINPLWALGVAAVLGAAGLV